MRAQTWDLYGQDICIRLQTCYILAEGCGNCLTIAAIAAVGCYAGIGKRNIVLQGGSGVAVSFADDDPVLCGYRASTWEVLPLTDVSSWHSLQHRPSSLADVSSTTFGSHRNEFPLTPALGRIIIPIARSFPKPFQVLFLCFRDKVVLSSGILHFGKQEDGSCGWKLYTKT